METLYFLHIPKTGGTAVTAALDAAFPPEAVMAGGLLDDVIDMPAERFAGYRFLRGHFGLLPLRRLGDAVTPFTLLRRPLDQLLSLYAHVREHAAHYLHGPAHAEGFSSFIRGPLWVAIARNPQARWLAVPPDGPATRWDPPVPSDYPYRVGAAFDLWPHGLDDDGLLARAAATLDRMPVVGTSEHSADAVAAVAAHAGLRLPRAPQRANVSRERFRPDALDPGDRAHLEALTEVDRRLYDLAARRAPTRPPASG